MRIVNFRPLAHPSVSGGIVAFFDLSLPTIRINGLALRRNRGGELRTVSPQVRGGQVAHFAPDFAEQITRSAAAVLNGGLTPNDIRH